MKLELLEVTGLLALTAPQVLQATLAQRAQRVRAQQEALEPQDRLAQLVTQVRLARQASQGQME